MGQVTNHSQVVIGIHLIKLLACIAFIFLAACETGQQTPTQPKLSDFASPITPANPDPDANDHPQQPSLTVLYVYRLLIPLESDLTRPLAPLETTALPDHIVKQYNANGVRLGHINLEGYHHLMTTLPIPRQDPRTPDEPPKPITDARVFRLTGLNQTIPLAVTPPVDYSFTFNYVTADNNVKSRTFTRGRCRFLTRTTASPAGEIRVQITPQHHLLKHTLVPRTPEETVLDGTVFNELTFSTTLDKNRFLVMACDIPHPQPPEPTIDMTPSQETDGEQPQKVADTQPQATNAPTTSEPKPPQTLPPPIELPNHFGTHWLSAQYRGQPVQLILIFQIQNH